MLKSDTKLRMRRLAKRRRKQVATIGVNTEQNLEKHFIKRLIRLPNVQRFLAGWIGLVLILGVGLVFQTRSLGGLYQTVQPKEGGTYSEGIIGGFTNANPMYASSSVDSSVSKLVFSSLLKYDDSGNLVGDLAESWTADERDRVYTVNLKPDVYWHDGNKLTSKDVVYTYQLIQNPETKSYLNPSWRGIKVEALDESTIVFTLPSSLSSFQYSLTNGIVPEHVLSKISPGLLRSSNFNNVSPIGSGPFEFSKVEVVDNADNGRQSRIALKSNESYYNGAPNIDTFIIRTYSNETQLIDAFTDKNVNAMVGLASIPDQFHENSEVKDYSITMLGQVMVFFKNDQDILKDKQVRKALVLGADKVDMLSKIPYPLVLIDSPLLKSHVGYDKSLAQATNNQEEAGQILSSAGWILNPETDIREKDGQKLSFRMYSQMTSEYSSVASSLQKQWKAIGVDMQVELLNDEDLQGALALHSYDALLYGISVGSDPDVFAYWHSSQADPRSATRLNFSEYNSPKANNSLEAGRTRSDSRLRPVKYKPFLEAWNADNPALALYQPRMLYVVREPLYGFDIKVANTMSDRFTNVNKWMVREGLQKTVNK